MQAIWYRHWLELRKLILIACVVTLLAAVGYGFAVTGAAGYFAKTGRLTQEIARYEAISQMTPEPELVPWAIHTLIVGFFALWVPGLFVGTALTGSGPNVFSGTMKHPSAYFTFSLPLARERIVGTRLAAAVGGFAMVLAVSLFAHVLLLLVIGQPIPITAMIKTSILGVVVALGLIAVASFLSLVLTETLGGLLGSLATFGLTMWLWLTKDGWNHTLQLIDGSSVRDALTVGAVSLLLIASTLVIVRRKEL